ncbi:hypothetical protein [uncultured Ilyobacter sp.]|uniref:hypothetical protein n=1 Tax=uncultured Ilyobacter sp. TaxID=544433 RepID=UPI0029C94E7D|nr:hypothetical protein [uncultured Ilyobacter sp.]
MMWLFIFLAVPVFSLISGSLVWGIFKVIFKFSSQIFLYLIVFSFACCTVFMTEEAFIGVFRKSYDKKIAILNGYEKDNVLKEIDLGDGKLLYYADSGDEIFGLNFNYKTGQNITRRNIIILAENWLEISGIYEETT